MKPERFYALSHQGLVRQNNEDYVLLLNELRLKAVGMVIADGIGGHNKGELASSVAATYAAKRMQKELHAHMSPKQIAELLGEIVEMANVKVYLESLQSPANANMGTTLTIAVALDDLLIIAHIGDCRMYRLHQSSLQLLTKDHTLIQALTDQGEDFQNQMQNPSRHMLTRALGVPAYMHADAYIYKLSKGDRILLCTDGLYGYLPERQISSLLAKSSTPKECAEDLIDGANVMGGGDNISLIVGFIG